MHSLNNRRRTKERKLEKEKEIWPVRNGENDRDDYTKPQTSDYTVLNKSFIYIIAFQAFDHTCYLT
mgnify:CR=1 FL=1